MLKRSYKDDLWKAFRKKAHRLLQMGYESALSKIREHNPEEDISGIIEKHIDDILMGGLCFEPEYLHIRTGNETPVNDDKRLGKKRLKIDIIVREPNSGAARVFAFEAKRLRTLSHPIGKYTGAGGMECFLTDDYVPDMPEASMVGYVQNKDMRYWEQQLRGKLKQSLKPIEVIKELPHEWVSSHKRESGTPLDIYHIFLDCRPFENG